MTTRTTRRLEDVQRRLVRAREDAKVLEEQVAVWNDALDDTRLRALVSETPLQVAEYDEVARHAAVAREALARRRTEINELTDERDGLLRQWSPN
jgi:chromosome segregation ATPase